MSPTRAPWRATDVDRVNVQSDHFAVVTEWPDGTRVATMNMRVDHDPPVAARGLNRIIPMTVGGFIALQEWGPDRNPLLKDTGRLIRVPNLNRLIRRKQPRHGITWARPLLGGVPAGADAREWELLRVRRVLLAKGRRVRKRPGRRGRKGDSTTTLTVWRHRETSEEHSLIDIHLTAHTQDGRRDEYRDPTDPAADMHRTAVRRLEALVAQQVGYGRRVWVAGDTNWHLLELDGLVSCWEGRAPAGTRGNRTIDIVYSADPKETP